MLVLNLCLMKLWDVLLNKPCQDNVFKGGFV
jgi:hypothetical protein